MLESFISTQKKSVQAALQKKFRRYMSFKQDFLQLTLHTLQVGILGWVPDVWAGLHSQSDTIQCY